MRPTCNGKRDMATVATPVDATQPGPVDALRETTRRYPSQKLRKRLEAEKAEMDAFVAESRAALARLIAERPVTVEAATEPDVAPDSSRITPDKTGLSPDKTHITQNKDQITPDKVETAPDSHGMAASSPPAQAMPAASAAESSAPAPLLLSRREQRLARAASWVAPRTIVDLTDGEGNPLPGVAWPKGALDRQYPDGWTPETGQGDGSEQRGSGAG